MSRSNKDVNPPITVQESGDYPIREFEGNLYRYAVYACMYVAIFSGRITLDRLFGMDSEVLFLELRSLSIVAVLLLYIIGKRIGFQETGGLSLEIRIFLGLLSTFLMYNALNVILIGESEIRTTYVYDIATTGLILWLVVSFSRMIPLLRGLAILAEIVGGSMFLLAAMGFGNPDLNGHAWAPIGGPITFYRIESFSLFAALYFSFSASNIKARLVHSILAVAFTFSILASLSKAAVVGLAVSIAFLVFYWLVIRASASRYFWLALIVGIALTAFSVKKADVLEARVIKSMIAGPEFYSSEPYIAGECVHTHILLGSMITKYSNNISLDDLSEKEVARLERLWQVFKNQGAPDYKTKTAAFIRWVSFLFVAGDGTTRMQMAQEALKHFRNSKLTGTGVGNYCYFTPNPVTDRFDSYRYPHNILLEIAASLGLIGVLLFLLTVSWSVVLILRQIGTYPDTAYWLALLVFFLATAMFSGDLYDFRIYWFLTLLLLVTPKTSESI